MVCIASLFSNPIPKHLLDLPDEGWTLTPDLADLNGPICFIIPGEEGAFLFVTASGTKLAFSQASQLEPPSVECVFVAGSLKTDVYSFKSAGGKYISCSSLGQISCSKEAVGPAEEWSAIRRGDGFVLRSLAHQTFLSLDGEATIRGDAEAVEEVKVLKIVCQAGRRKERLLTEASKRAQQISTELDLDRLAAEETRKYAGRGIQSSSVNSSDLKRAAEEGTLREALLERRIKSKHDPFC